MVQAQRSIAHTRRGQATAQDFQTAARLRFLLSTPTSEKSNQWLHLPKKEGQQPLHQHIHTFTPPTHKPHKQATPQASKQAWSIRFAFVFRLRTQTTQRLPSTPWLWTRSLDQTSAAAPWSSKTRPSLKCEWLHLKMAHTFAQHSLARTACSVFSWSPCLTLCFVFLVFVFLCVQNVQSNRAAGAESGDIMVHGNAAAVLRNH